MTCGDPCDCKNPTTFEPCGDNVTCCEFCPDGAPCAYAILSKCCWFRDNLYLSQVTPLWKECLFDCRWTSRSCRILPDPYSNCDEVLYGMPWVYDLLGCGSDQCGCSERTFHPNAAGTMPPGGIANTEDCDSGIVQCFPPVCYDAATNDYKPTTMKFGCGPIANNEDATYLCGWHDWYHRTYNCDWGPTGWTDDFEACTHAAWDLSITAEGESLLIANKEGDSGDAVEVARYVCDTFDCLGRNTFTIEGEYPVDGFPELPKQLCVVPYSSKWESPCETKEDACNCYDPGWNNFCLDISGVECGVLFQSTTPVSLTRNAAFSSDGYDYSGEIAAPDPAPCGYFYGTASAICPGGTADRVLGFLVWCDGSDWRIQVYCIIYGDGYGTTATLLCDTTFTVTDTCPDGMRGTFDCGTAIVGDCCPECDFECCDPAADELSVVITPVDGCCWTAITTTAVYGGGPDFSWTANEIPSQCDGQHVIVIQCIDGVYYIAYTVDVTTYNVTAVSSVDCPSILVETEITTNSGCRFTLTITD